MPAPNPRPDLDAHLRAVHLPTSELVAELCEVLGTRLVAYIAGASSTSTVSRWAAGNDAPDGFVESRLRAALHAALTVAAADDPAIAQAWFQGRAPELEDVSPARLLRDGDPAEAHRMVTDAARSYLTRA